MGMPQERSGTAQRILPAVLAVSVHSDDSGVCPALGEEGEEPHFQRLAFSAVLRQVDHQTGQRFKRVKIWLAVWPASVIHHDDVAESRGLQVLHSGDQTLVRVIGGDQRTNVHFFHSISWLLALDAFSIFPGNERAVRAK